MHTPHDQGDDYEKKNQQWLNVLLQITYLNTT